MVRVSPRASLAGSIALFLGLALAESAAAQNTYAWNNTADNGLWLSTGNWTTSGSTSTVFPGASGNNSLPNGLGADIAVFDSTTTASAVNIDFSTAGANGTLALGAISFTNANNGLTIGAVNGNGLVTLNGASLDSLSNVILSNTSGNQTLTIAGTTGSYTLGLVLGGASNVIYANAGSTISISSVISGSGSISLQGGGTLTLTGANTYTGGTTVSAGCTLTLTNGGALGGPSGSGGAVVNNGVLNLLDGANYNFGAISGNGATNIAVAGGSVNNATWTGYSGILNIGIDQGAGAGKVNLNGVLNPNMTVNITANCTLYVASNVTDDATLNLYGGTTGEIYGQLRLDGATWGGNITLYNSMAAGDSFIGSFTNNATITGTITGVNSPLSTGGSSNATITLTGANNYWTNTIINNGTLKIGLGSQLNSGSYAYNVSLVSASSLLEYSSTAASTQTISGVISGPGGLMDNSSSSLLLLTGVNTYTGNTTVSAGTLQIGGAGQLGSAGNVAVAGTLQYSSSANQILSGVVSGAGALLKDTSATSALTLTGANTFSGSITLNAGTLIMTNPSASLNASLTVGSGTEFIYQPTSPASLSFGSGVITLANNSTIGASLGGTIVSTGAASVSGSVTVNVYGIPGTSVTPGSNTLLSLGAGSNLVPGNFSLGIVYNATDFTVSGLTTTSTSVSVTVAAVSAYQTEYWLGGYSGGAGVWGISNGSTISNWASTQGGAVTSLVPGSTATVVLSATGATNQGSMSLGANMNIAGLVVNDTTPILLQDSISTLTIGTGGITVNNADGNPNVTLAAGIILSGPQAWQNASTNPLIVSGSVANGSNLLTVQGAGNTLISGVLSGTGGLTAAGSGTLTLSGANTYTGTTTLAGGTLSLGSGENAGFFGPLGVGSVGSIVFSGGALEYSAANQFDYSSRFSTAAGQLYNVNTNGQNVTWGAALTSSGGSLTVSGPGTLILTNANNTFSGGTTINAGATLQVGNGGSTGSLGGGLITVNGTLAYNFNGSTTVSLPSGSGITGVTGALTAAAEVIKLNGNINVGGSQSYTEVGGGNTYTGIWVNANTVLTATSITMYGDIGAMNGQGTTLTLNTSASNGTINLDISIGRSGIWYNLTGFTADAGAGAINLTGTGLGTSGAWSNDNLPVTLTGAVNFSANVQATNVLTINTNGTTTGIVSGILSGNVALAVQGPGALSISAASTYTGGTTVTGGTLLAINRSGSGTGTGAVTVQSGGTLGGNGTISSGGNAVTIGSGGAITGGIVVGAGSTGALTITSSTAVKISGTYSFNLATAGNTAGLNSGGSTPAFSSQAQMLALTNHDILNINGSGGLTFNSGSTINITITDTSASSTQPYSWLIATTQYGTGSITGVTNIGIGTLTASGANFAGVSTTTFTLGAVGSNLYLNYTPAATPEPEHVLLMCVGVMLAGWGVRRRWRNQLAASD